MLPYAGSSCVNPEHSTIFNLTSWIGNDQLSFFKNFVHVPNKVFVVDMVQFEFVYTEESGNLFSYHIGEYALVNKSYPLLKHQFTHAGNYTIHLQVSSQRFPSFISRTTLSVEYKVLSALLDIVPSVIHINGTKNNSIQAFGTLFGGGIEMDVYWKLSFGFNNSLQKIQG